MNDGQLEGQMSIFDFLNEPKKEPAQVEEAKKEPICSYSEHVCNKNELFKVAESLDNPFCPHVCCRLCSDFECGARCNGANKTNRKQEELPDRFNDWIGSDYAEYICKNLRENELLEYTLKKIRSIKCNVNDSAFYKEFRKAMFEHSKNYFFKVDGEAFELKISVNDKPGFDECGVCFVHHCGSDNNKVLGNLLAKDIYAELTEKNPVDVRGYMDYGYCPICGASLNDYDEECDRCHSLIDWSNYPDY